MHKLIALALLLAPSLALANGYETYPAPLAWSPDSQQLAVAYSATWPYDEGIVNGTLKLFDREGQPVSELASGQVGSPAFGPDSLKLIAVVDGKLAMFEMYTDAPVHFYETPPPVLECAWAADAKQADPRGPDDGPQPPDILLTIGERFYGADIWRMNFLGTRIERVTSHRPPQEEIDEMIREMHEADAATPIHESPYHPTFDSAIAPLASRDGAALWFLYQPSYDGGTAYERLYTLDIASGQFRQAAQPADPANYPDNYHESNPVELSASEVLFQRGGWGDWKLIRLDLASGAETVEMADAQQPSLSADGRWLGFTRRPADQKARMEYDWEVLPQVWLADRQSGQQWRVPQSIAGGEFPTVSPDGTLLAWLEFDRGAVQVRIESIAELTSEPATLVADATVGAGTAVFSGQLLDEGGHGQGYLSIELVNHTTESIDYKMNAEDTGGFYFDEVIPGNYRFVVRTLDGQELALSSAAPSEFSIEAGQALMRSFTICDVRHSDSEEHMGQFNVVLETTKGNIVLAVHPEWSPKGAAHFRELVEAGYYDGAPWFRVIDGFVAQIGISADPALNVAWGERTIGDEPVAQGNKPGFVAYGQSAAPNSRSTHFFINYADNSRLDASGFACFAEVTSGMDIARNLAKVEYDDQGGLARAGGIEAFKRRFPNADYVTRAFVQ